MLSRKLQKYMAWSALNSWSSSVASVLSTNSMLSAITTEVSYTTTITTTYVGKDIIGQMGGLLYALRDSGKADTSPLKHAKKGSLLLGLGIFVENATPILTGISPWFTLPTLGIANFCKNVSWISIGAVSTKNMQKIDHENLGKLYTQISASNTVASTLGMITGISLLHFIPSYTIRSLCVIPPLIILNLYSIKRATEIAQEK